MTHQNYQPGIIIKNLIEEFLPFRKITKTESEKKYTNDEIISSMEHYGFVRIDAECDPRGSRNKVVIIIINVNSKLSQHGADLRKFVENIESESVFKEKKINELIFVVDESFTDKKNLVEIVYKLRSGPNVYDPNGDHPYINVIPFYVFSYSLPKSNVVPEHILLHNDELEKILESEHISYNDLPIIHAHDPAVIWIGGRIGQVVKINRISHTSGVSVFFRRIER